MKKILSLFLAVMLLAALSACGGQNPPASAPVTSKPSGSEPEPTGGPEPANIDVTITHELGEATIQTNPSSVVVFDYGLLDALDAAGVSSVTGVPKSGSLPEHLEKYSADAYVNVGSLKDADYEAINEIKPDLILITARMSGSYEDLNAIAPTIYLPMPGPTYLQTFEENMNVLASIFTNETESLTGSIGDAKERTAAIKEAAAGKSALLIQTSDDALNVFGHGSRYAVLYSDFGFTLTDESIEESTHGQAASFEYVAEQNPDYLFVVDRSAAIGTDGATGAAALLDNELINGTDAAKNGKVFYLNSTNWYTVSGGITSTRSMLSEVEAALGIS